MRQSPFSESELMGNTVEEMHCALSGGFYLSCFYFVKSKLFKKKVEMEILIPHYYFSLSRSLQKGKFLLKECVIISVCPFLSMLETEIVKILCSEV